MPQTIYIIRHAETDDNVNSKFQGWNNSPLTSDGHIQAKKLAKRLSDSPITVIYTSDLLRTKETAAPLAKQLELIPKENEDVKEHGLGSLEGYSWINAPKADQKIMKGLFESLRSRDLHWKDHQGETLHEFYERLTRFLDHIKEQHSGENIAVVTHGGTINRLFEILGFKQNSDDFIMFGNTSVTILQKNGDNYEVELLNDTSHLK